jgi:hypothetical protein
MTRLARRAVGVVVALVATTAASAGLVALDAPVAQATTTRVVPEPHEGSVLKRDERGADEAAVRTAVRGVHGRADEFHAVGA